MILFNPWIAILYAAFFGATMKIADLFNEHGVKKWFTGCDIVFGIVWGMFGALIILSNEILASMYLALVFAFIIRARGDYVNHGLAYVIMIITYFIRYQFVNWQLFLIFFIPFSIFGLISDQYRAKKLPKNKLLRILRILSDFRAHYYWYPFIYSLITGIWFVFFVMAINMLFYEIIRQWDFKRRNLNIFGYP